TLSAGAAALQKTNERMERLGEGFREATAGLSEIRSALATGLRDLQRVAQQFEATSARFGGIDEALANTLQELATQYEAFAQRVGETVGQIDENLAKAVTSLENAIRELSEVVEDLQPVQASAVRRP
ncbi:MAG: hypothetical protein NZ555_14465, partial [Geminicoccaceae bacterium]|nr:hypothetical protein [Geminicoccaceae bacterium]